MEASYDTACRNMMDPAAGGYVGGRSGGGEASYTTSRNMMDPVAGGYVSGRSGGGEASYNTGRNMMDNN